MDQESDAERMSLMRAVPSTQYELPLEVVNAAPVGRSPKTCAQAAHMLPRKNLKPASGLTKLAISAIKNSILHWKAKVRSPSTVQESARTAGAS